MTTSSSSVNKRTLLLQIGQEIFATHGFTNVGLSELLKIAGIPKGSFYHYFASKEEYGVKVIQYYMDNYAAQIADRFDDHALTGKERLLSYCQYWNTTQCDNDYQGRCLVVKLSSEVTDFSEAMRLEFCIGTSKILGLITQVIQDGQQDSSIPLHLDPSATAQTLYQYLLGASLMTKIMRNDVPFQTAMQFTNALLSN